MKSFTVSLAGIPIGIRPRTAETQAFFRDYVCEDAPVFSVAAEDGDLRREQALYQKRNRTDASAQLAEPLLEQTALLRLIAEKLPAYDTVLFHGSVLAAAGKAVLFAARSGTGKTTHTRLWLQQLPQAHVLNGDKPFLRLEADGGVLACGTPWRGKEGIGRNESLPLEAILFLERAKENRIVPMSPQETTKALMQQLYLPEGAAGLQAIRVLDGVLRRTRLFHLYCNMEAEAARLSIRAVFGDNGIG